MNRQNWGQEMAKISADDEPLVYYAMKNESSAKVYVFLGRSKLIDERNNILAEIAFQAKIREQAKNLGFTEAIIQAIGVIQNFLNKILVVLEILIAQKFKPGSIGKGIEGFITYVTWARPPCNSQFVQA